LPVTTFFSIVPEDLGRLGSTEAVGLFGQLLWAQARRKGVPTTKVRFSLRQDVADGGIDAAVEPDAFQGVDDALVQGNTFYQIKTGTSAKPWQPGWVRGELFGERGLVGEANLGSAVRDCLDKGGRYVLVCFGASLNPDQQRTSEQSFKGFFAQCGFPEARVAVWGQETLVGLFSVYPSLCLAITGRHDVCGYQSHASWADNDDMTLPVVLGDAQNRLVKDIQDHLRGKAVRFVRLVGEPGVGKTRLVLEATRADDLAPCVLYVPHAEEFLNSALMQALLAPDAAYYVILVLDECSIRDGAAIWNLLKKRSHGIVAINHEPSNSYDEAMCEFPCPALDDEQIGEILRSYVPDQAECSRWVEECGGSPRVAHAVGENLRAHPEDVLRSPATVPIWDRFVAGASALGSPEVQQRLIVLRHLSLFAKFGFEPPVQDEARCIAEIAREVDPGLTFGQFQEVVGLLRRRRILQGKRTLFIVPPLLQKRLLRDFWDNYGRGLDVAGLVGRLRPTLRPWFIKMLRYAHLSQVAKNAVEEFLEPDGAFCRSEGRKLGEECDCLPELAQAVPELTLSCIERIVERIGTNGFNRLGFHGHRLIFALQWLAVWRALFVRSATAILDLTSASDGVQSDAFVELFSMAAVTEAEPRERLPVLKAAIASDDRRKRELGVKTCRNVLSMTSHGGSVCLAYQGLQPTARVWRPGSRRERFDALVDVWKLLFDQSRGWAEEERRNANQVLVEQATGLLFRQQIDDLVLSTLERLADDEATDLAGVVQMTVRCRKTPAWQKYLSAEAIRRLGELDERITGTTFWGRVRRFVLFTGMHDRFYGGDEELAGKIGDLAREAGESPGLLEPLLDELVKGGPGGIYAFGCELAKHDPSRRLLARIVDAQRAAPSGTAQLLGGYLRWIHDSDFAEWRRVMEGLRAEALTEAVADDLVFRSGYAASELDDMLADYDAGRISFSHFEPLTVVCAPTDVDESRVLGLLDRWNRLEGQKSPDFPVRLVRWYYCRSGTPRSMPEGVVLDLLRNDAIYASREFDSGCWEEVVERFVLQFPARTPDIFQAIMEQIYKSESRLFGSDWCVQTASRKLIRSAPQGCWEIVSRRLADAGNGRGGAIWHWLDAAYYGTEPDAGLLSLFPEDSVLAWAAESPRTRAVRVAELVPGSLDDPGLTTLARQLLILFGDRADVRGAMAWHLVHAGVSALDANHYQQLRERALAWLKDEAHPNVRRWLDQVIQSLTTNIKQAEIEEERGY